MDGRIISKFHKGCRQAMEVPAKRDAMGEEDSDPRKSIDNLKIMNGRQENADSTRIRRTAEFANSQK